MNDIDSIQARWAAFSERLHAAGMEEEEIWDARCLFFMGATHVVNIFARAGRASLADYLVCLTKCTVEVEMYGAELQLRDEMRNRERAATSSAEAPASSSPASTPEQAGIEGPEVVP